MQCNVLGLMSGTSLDGIDLVIVRFIKRDKWYFKIIKAKTYSYSEDWKKTLENLHNLSKKDINIKDRKYGILLANKINEFIIGEKIDLISSHGHTIFHEPKKK